MYRMQNRKKDIRIYVRNKARYNPETKERAFLFVDITDFAGTTIGDIKENVRQQTKGAVKINELFLNNVKLADDRSVAHYNIEDGSILETTSNPLWVACLYIKAAEVTQQQQLHPEDESIQKWTSKSLPKKYTIIGILLNSSNAYGSQPPHFPTLEDFVIYLERLGKKGATMHPNYTQADLAKMEMEFHRDFENKFDDPIAAFVDHHAVQLGYINPDEAERKLRQPAIAPINRNAINYTVYNETAAAGNRPRPVGNGGVGGGGNRNNNRRQVQSCDDCETSLAVLYCFDCQNATDGHGVSLCKRCCDLLHTGATRRRHNIADISQAPKTANTKPYVPRAFLAPFSILLAMYSALSDPVPKLSMTEDEIKIRAQSLTDTDLQDKQNGKYVGGFDCMENVLIAKGLVKKEAARTPTYALTDLGHALGEKLLLFYRKLLTYLSSCQLPKLPDNIRTSCAGNRKICLLIDENERDKGRLLKFAEEKGIDAQTRYLPAGDYIWILTPPMMDTRQKYTGKQSDAEVVLPFIVERKSWEDFENSVKSSRFQRQVNNMLGSGVKNCFYLMEGSPGSLRHNATQQRQQYLKGLVEKLTYDYGFFVNYTASWMKSAQWLLWLTQLIVEAYKQGKLADRTLPYKEYSSRVAVLNGSHPPGFQSNCIRHAHTWPAQLFVDHIFRDELGDRSLVKTVQGDLGLQGREQHLLIIQGLEQYNKKRQSTLNKCCSEIHDKPHDAEEIVNRLIGASIHNMVHYDITCYKQLYIQVMTGVYILRTETDKETEQVQQAFMAGPRPPSEGNNRSTTVQPPRKPRSPRVAIPRPASSILPMVNPFKSPDQSFSRNSVHDNASELNVDMDSSHDLPPGCRVANIPKCRQPAESKFVTEFRHDFQAFSGTGFTLGSGPTSRSINRPSATITSENQILQSDKNDLGDKTIQLSSRLDFAGSGQIGSFSDSLRRNSSDDSASSVEIPRDDTFTRLNSGKSDVTNMRPFGTYDNMIQPFGSNRLGKEDFANQENEDQILKEVLSRSKQNIVAISTDSQEDPELQLALMLSRETNNETRTANIGVHRPVSEQPIAADTGVIEDPELQLALLLSSEGREENIAGGTSHIPERARENPERDKSDTIEIQDSQEDEDSALKKVIEMSKQNSRSAGTANIRTVTNDQSETVISLDDSENVDNHDDHLKLAIEMSKQINTPEKCVEKETDALILEIIERSKTDSVRNKTSESDFDLGQALEKSKHESPDESQQLKEAIERSKVEHTSKKRENDHELMLAIERSKLEHTPKRVEYEDRNLKLAINRSILDQSPKPAAVKRKLDASEICAIRNKIPKESSGTLLCSFQEPNNAVMTEHESIEVIEIDSQSQEIDSEELGIDSVVSEQRNTALQKQLVKDSSQQLLESVNENKRNITDPIIRESVQNSSEERYQSPPHCDVVCGTSNEEEMNIDDGEGFVPPSPNKSAGNTSQLNSSLQSGASCMPLCVTASGSKKTEMQAAESTKLLKGALKRNGCNKSDFEEQFGEPENESESTDRGENRDSRNSRTKDFCLKTSLLRFVDENASESDYDSNDESDDDDEGKLVTKAGFDTDSESIKSAEDIFSQTDIDPVDGFCSKEVSSPDDKNADCVPSVEINVPKYTTKNSLVNKIVVNELPKTLNKGNNFADVEGKSKNNDVTAQKLLLKNCDKDMNKRTVSVEQETVGKISSDMVRKDLNNLDDSYMDEVDFLPDLDDIDNDPTYEAGKDGSDSSDRSFSDSAEDIDELMSRVDPEFLPKIDGPKRRRKNTPKKEVSKKTETRPDIINVKIKEEKVDALEENFKMEKPDSPRLGTGMDAAFAKLLDKQINDVISKTEISSASNVLDDEMYARQVQAELEFKGKIKDNTGDQNEQYQSGCNGRGYNETAELVKELQRRELEKLKRMAEDERIARMMQDDPDLHPDPIEDPISSEGSAIPKNFRKLFAEDRALREKSAAQVDEYRRMQSQKYQSAHTQVQHTDGSGLIVDLTDTTPSHDNSVGGRSDFARPYTINNHPHDKPSHSSTGSFPFDLPDLITLDNSVSQSQSNSTAFTQSVAGRLTPHGQSKPTAAPTCGNCGEKGHTRKDPNCPKYNTPEEMARREAQLESRRQKQEERKRDELENINLLSRHQRAIEEMNHQLEAEVSAIQSNLHQRARELERQVNSRVKKMENAEKRKKKK